MRTLDSEMISGAWIFERMYGMSGTMRCGSVASALRISGVHVQHAECDQQEKKTYRPWNFPDSNV